MGDKPLSELSGRSCSVCHVGAPRLTDVELAAGLARLPHWQAVVREGITQLQRCYRFRDFVTAMAYAQQLGQLAEAAGHHPAILVEWGKVEVRWWTHKIQGLHENDLIMAARTEELYLAAGH